MRDFCYRRNVQSKEILSRELTERQTDVNSNGLASGMYYWSLKKEDLIKSGKLIIK